MNNIEIKIKILEHNKEKKKPFYATEGAAGMDLSACIDEDIVINPMERALIPTGIAIKLPSADYGAFIFARSGLSVKKGLCLANGVGVVDSDYTGEIFVGLCNVSSEPYTLMPLDRIAQLTVMSILPANPVEVDTLEETARGSGGFGSTGR